MSLCYDCFYRIESFQFLHSSQLPSSMMTQTTLLGTMHRVPVFYVVLWAVTWPGVLTTIYSCSNCGLQRIPTDISNDTNELHVKGNRLRHISRIEIMSLVDMTVLDVSSNILMSVEFGAFIGLNIEHLDLSNNRLEEIPNIEPLALNLTELLLSNNRIATIEPFIFENFTTLRRIILSVNEIAKLADYALSAPLTQLDSVIIERNGLAVIGKLTFAETDVENLTLDQNALVEFPCLQHIISIQYLSLRKNVINAVPEGCGQWWGWITHLYLQSNSLTSIDNITKYTSRLQTLYTSGSSLILSDDTFKNASRLSTVHMYDVNQFPWFHGSKTTIESVLITGKDVTCVDGAHLDGMNAVKVFQLQKSTSIIRLPHLGCSGDSAKYTTSSGYFKSLTSIKILYSKLEKLPSLHHATRLQRIIMARTRVATVDVSEIPELSNLWEWVLVKSRLNHFLNITALGNQSRLAILRLSENRISSVPCFPDTFKSYHLTTINLNMNRINYICNLNFAPNIANLYLMQNRITADLFLASTTTPLWRLTDVIVQTNKIDAFSDSSLLIVPNCKNFKIERNNLSILPNIKLIASTIVNVWLKSNSIPEVPCSTLGRMEQLIILDLSDNQITYVCPQILSLSPKLTGLRLDNNSLIEVADLRKPARSQPTSVRLDHNPLKCVAALCWMLLVPLDGYLQLSLENLQCMAPTDDSMTAISRGLSAECTSNVHLDAIQAFNSIAYKSLTKL